MNETYLDLRDKALRTSASTVRLPPNAREDAPFGIVTDIAFRGGSATVVAMVDGNASIYLSGGGGFVGGSGRAAIQKAATAAIGAARDVIGKMRQTEEFPLPAPDNVQFYVLTSRGVLTASMPERDLQDARRPFGRLYEAVQEIITQYRSIS
jgi:hypothetical protein